jgi:hypothetical protein
VIETRGERDREEERERERGGKDIVYAQTTRNKSTMSHLKSIARGYETLNSQINFAKDES